MNDINESPLRYYTKSQTQKLKEKIANDKVIVDSAYRDWETDRKSTRLNSSHRL